MTIKIQYSELNLKIEEIWDNIYNLSIDFYTNTLNGNYKDKEYELFCFNDYGWITDNRYKTYEIMKGVNDIHIFII